MADKRVHFRLVDVKLLFMVYFRFQLHVAFAAPSLFDRVTSDPWAINKVITTMVIRPLDDPA